MRNLLFILCLLLTSGGLFSRANANSSQRNVPTKDSTVTVIGRFLKGETLDYWFTQTVWQVGNRDTMKLMSTATKTRVTVEDSAANGYKMGYTFLEFLGDTVDDFFANNIQNMVLEICNKQIVGTKVNFETDAQGRIIKYTNLENVKNQMKSFLEETMNELYTMPESQILKWKDIDVREVAKKININSLVDGSLGFLQLLFVYYGSEYKLGEVLTHNPGTETSYENSICTNSFIYDSGCYFIETMIGNNISTGELLKGNALMMSYVKTHFFPAGIPFKIISEESTQVGENRTVSQTSAYLDDMFDHSR